MTTETETIEEMERGSHGFLAVRWIRSLLDKPDGLLNRSWRAD